MLKHTREKTYYEYLAKIVLEQLLPKEYSNLELSDSPDLRSSCGNDIEVTRSIYPGEPEATHLFNLAKNIPLKDVNHRVRSRIEQLGYMLKEYKGVVLGMYPKEAIWETTQELNRAFSNKLNKINSYDGNVDLFIYAPSFDMYDTEMILDFFNWAASQQGKNAKRYENIIVFDYISLYICNFSTMLVRHIHVDKEQVNLFVQNAKHYVDNL